MPLVVLRERRRGEEEGEEALLNHLAEAEAEGAAAAQAFSILLVKLLVIGSCEVEDLCEAGARLRPMCLRKTTTLWLNSDNFGPGYQ